MDQQLQNYIEQEIIPQYRAFDPAHQPDHIYQVIDNSLALANSLPVNPSLVYTIAAYHDLGLSKGRVGHETASKLLVYQDQRLRDFFKEDEILLIGQAVEDHRASIEYEPRSIYGKIVSDADRDLDLDRLIQRTLSFIHHYYVQADYYYCHKDTYDYLLNKYGPQAELRLWLDLPASRQRLAELQSQLMNKDFFKKQFNQIYQNVVGPVPSKEL